MSNVFNQEDYAEEDKPSIQTIVYTQVAELKKMWESHSDSN